MKTVSPIASISSQIKIDTSNIRQEHVVRSEVNDKSVGRFVVIGDVAEVLRLRTLNSNIEWLVHVLEFRIVDLDHTKLIGAVDAILADVGISVVSCDTRLVNLNLSNCLIPVELNIILVLLARDIEGDAIVVDVLAGSFV